MSTIDCVLQEIHFAHTEDKCLLMQTYTTVYGCELLSLSYEELILGGPI